MVSLQELCEFLSVDTRPDLKAMALEYVLGITTDAAGRKAALECTALLLNLVSLMEDPSPTISNDAALAVINMTAADEGVANEFLSIPEPRPPDGKCNPNLVLTCIRYIMDKESILADPCCMILSNITRPEYAIDRVITLIEKSGYSWDNIMSAFTANQYNNTGAKLHYLGPVFCNLSRSPRFRRYLMDRERNIIQRLLPFIEYPDSIVRRSSIAGAVKNCCFDIENHEWLLSPEVDILTYLLLPLAGPEKFDDEDNDKLPSSLQYLPETKKREPDVQTRITLLEALAQLCATRKSRELLREQNAYVILREYHKWEQDEYALTDCENVVQMLIRTEEEIGVDNLKDLEEPSESIRLY